MIERPAGRRHRLRVAVVGAGWAGRQIWLPRLQADPGYQVAYLVDPSPATLALVERDRIGTGTLADHRLLRPEDVDLAVVAVPNHLHAEIAADLLRVGIDVFVEKPVCLTTDEARRLAVAEHSAGAMLVAGSAARYRADVLALYRLAAELGAIRHLDLSWVRARGVPGRDGWFTRRELSGGGALVDLGWHLLDVARPLLGDSPIEHAVGTLSGDFVNRPASRAAWRAEADRISGLSDVEDTARGFLVTADGVSLGIRASWASHEPQDATEIRVEAAGGTATLRCTFGFSPNREGCAQLRRTVDGVTESIELTEPIGTEYDRQLAALPALLADRANAGRAIAEARQTIGVIERLYRVAAPSFAASADLHPSGPRR